MVRCKEPRLALILFSPGRKQQCAGKSAATVTIPGQVDLLAIIALLIAIVAVWIYFADSSPPPTSSAFIVPSQSVRW
jgi:hypothetical protein